MNKGEYNLCEWQYSRCGGFMNSLMTTISKADSGNLQRLKLAYPLEVEAMIKFKTLKGYWPNLKDRFNDGEQIDKS